MCDRIKCHRPPTVGLAFEVPAHGHGGREGTAAQLLIGLSLCSICGRAATWTQFDTPELRQTVTAYLVGSGKVEPDWDRVRRRFIGLEDANHILQRGKRLGHHPTLQ